MAVLPPPPLASGPDGPSPSIPFVDSMEVDGGVPQRGTDGIGDGGDTKRRTDGGGEPKTCTDAGGGKRPQTPATGSCLVPMIMKASRKSANTGIRSPMQATSSPGVNFLLKSAAVKKEAVTRASMAGSPKTPQPPSCSPSLHDLSPDTRATNSQASKRKHRKLISDIWKEAEPIYKDGKLVEVVGDDGAMEAQVEDSEAEAKDASGASYTYLCICSLERSLNFSQYHLHRNICRTFSFPGSGAMFIL